MAVDPSLAGRTFPATEPYAVSREKVLEFARATGSSYDGTHAPATFPIVVAFAAMTGLMADPEVGISLHRVVHGDQRFAYTRPVVAGDALVCVNTVEEITSRGGHDFLTTRTDVTTEGGEPVLTAWSKLVQRGEEKA